MVNQRLNTFKVCTFYTRGTAYKEEAYNLQKSARKHGIEVYVEAKKNMFSWRRNVQQRPQFILDCMARFGCDIVWVDADAEFKAYPKLFDTLTEDIAVHYKKGRELLGGTIYLRNNGRVKALMRDWIKEQATDKYNLQQVALVVTLKRHSSVTINRLPAPYTLIFDSMRKEGPAIIQHNQASRRLKKRVRREDMQIPKIIGTTRIRHWPDGSFGLARKNKQIENQFDGEHVRVPNELRWWPREHDGIVMETLRPSFNGKKCVLIGKGPSLDHLTKDHFDPDDVVIAINESIHAVLRLGLDNTVYSLQQDASLRDTCHSEAIIFISRQARKFYARHDNKVLYYPEDYKATPGAASVVCAMRIVKHLGCTGFKLYCFDACVNKNLEYANCVGHTPGNNPQRFLKHRRVIEHECRDTDASWFCPEPMLSRIVQADTSSDTPQLSLDNQTEHHEPDEIQPSVEKQDIED